MKLKNIGLILMVVLILSMNAGGSIQWLSNAESFINEGIDIIVKTISNLEKDSFSLKGDSIFNYFKLDTEDIDSIVDTMSMSESDIESILELY